MSVTYFRYLFNMSVPQLFFAFLSITTVSALYFHIGETEKKCFIEEIPDETMVVGKFVTKYCNVLVEVETSPIIISIVCLNFTYAMFCWKVTYR